MTTPATPDILTGSTDDASKGGLFTYTLPSNLITTIEVNAPVTPTSTTPAIPDITTGATENEALGGLFTDNLISGISDSVRAELLEAQGFAEAAEQAYKDTLAAIANFYALIDINLGNGASINYGTVGSPNVTLKHVLNEGLNLKNEASSASIFKLQNNLTAVPDDTQIAKITFQTPDEASAPLFPGQLTASTLPAFQIVAESTAAFGSTINSTKLSFRANDQPQFFVAPNPGVEAGSALNEVFTINPDGSVSLPSGEKKLRFHTYVDTPGGTTFDESYIKLGTNNAAIRNSGSPLTDLTYNISYEADRHYFYTETGGGATPTYQLAMSIQNTSGSGSGSPLYIKTQSAFPVWIEDTGTGVGNLYLGSTFNTANRVNSTAAEINVLDASNITAPASTQIENNDVLMAIEGSVTKQIRASDIKDYINGAGSGQITAVNAGTGLNGGGTNGDLTLNVDAAQTGITSILNVDLEIGKNANTQIHFENGTNNIELKANVNRSIFIGDNAYGTGATEIFPYLNSNADIGIDPDVSGGLTFRNAFFDGAIQSGTFKATTAPSAGDPATVGFVSNHGLVLQGQGTAADVTLRNSSGNFVAYIPTGTTSFRLPNTPDNGNSNVPLKVAGLETIWIPASNMRPRITDGFILEHVVHPNSSSAIFPEIEGFKCNSTDTNVAKYAEFGVALPKSWNGGTVTSRLHVINLTGSTANIENIFLRSSAMKNGDFIGNATFAGGAEYTNGTATTSTNMYYVFEGGAITVNNNPTGNGSDLINFQLYSSAITSAANFLIVGVQVFFTTDAKNDA